MKGCHLCLAPDAPIERELMEEMLNRKTPYCSDCMQDVFEMRIRPYAVDFALPGQWTPLLHTGLRELPLVEAFDEVLGPWLVYNAHDYKQLQELLRPYFHAEEGKVIPMPVRDPKPGVYWTECRRYGTTDTVEGFVTLKLVPEWVATTEEELNPIAKHDLVDQTPKKKRRGKRGS